MEQCFIPLDLFAHLISLDIMPSSVFSKAFRGSIEQVEDDHVEKKRVAFDIVGAD